MNRGVISILFIILPFRIFSQSNITFNLDVHELINKKLFLPSNGEKILIRGSFNNWTSEEFILLKQNSDNIYSNTFKIVVSIGDTIQYKYVIKKSDGRYYWERNPNPKNPAYGNRQLVITDTNLILKVTEFNYDEFIRYPIVFSREKLQEDFLQMRKEVEEKHPALYDYTDKKTLDSLFDYYYSKIDSSLGFNEFYRIVSSVIERIGCGHTKLWIPSDYWNSAAERFFPLELSFTQNKVFVKGFYSASENIPIGSEIISINKKLVTEIIMELKSITSSDAFIEAFKTKSVEKNFSPKYALYYGYPDKFRIEYIPPKENSLNSVDLKPADGKNISMNPFRGNELSLRLLEEYNAAILTINSFIYYDRLEMFKAFIDSSFQKIKNENIKNLIIDLRGNDGGDPYCSSYLLSYIEHEPVRYFAEPYKRYEKLAEPVQKAIKDFNGNLYTLIDGSAFSTTGHFCALLKYNKIGKLIGSETGATYTCTGSVHYVNLINTKLILGTARKMRYNAAVENMKKNRGIMPDHFIEQNQNDLISGNDTVLNFVIENLIMKPHN